MGRQIKVLFVCTANACRSQMAEALLRHLGGDRFEACSAGAHPVGFIHPLATATMDHLNVSMEGQRSKSWDEFAGADIDLVITLCDSAAGEPCPALAGTGMRVHWSTTDPVTYEGTDSERLWFAFCTADQIKARIQRLVQLDFKKHSKEELRRRLEAIAQIS